ncbi:thymidylate synthase [Pseudomonas phage Lana]|uniref:Thymidylate synthase n=1 Tax=Pseudomonas phage Lana TaxID=2530172 RepID=A0A481W7R7_9CAUD|nr:thymidylate synthase [Pseudomonas phage Lana]QBJ04529.1 thymidylate synthase [Pseudomonas phage Lana]
MKAELIDHMGSDLTVVNAARVSFDKTSEFADADGNVELLPGNVVQPTGKYLREEDVKLIKYLASHGHWTPASHPIIQLRETVPIFVARQRFKHMVGFTYNEVSRRYVDDTPEFYVPEMWRSRPDKSIKQGSGGTHPKTQFWSDRYGVFIAKAEQLYSEMVADGVAPEQARMVLPQSMLTSYYVTGSLYAWARATKQRVDAHAQYEIQLLGHQWDAIIEPLFPVSWAAFSKG